MNLDNYNNKTDFPGLINRIKLFFKQDYFRNKIVFWLLILSIIANLTNWVVLLVYVRPTESNIILHYNVYFGVDVMGAWKSVFFVPIIGIIIFMLNVPLSIYFYKYKERIATHILLMATLMAQLSLLIASISVILINY